jgi:hypothetical protein
MARPSAKTRKNAEKCDYFHIVAIAKSACLSDGSSQTEMIRSNHTVEELVSIDAARQCANVLAVKGDSQRFIANSTNMSLSEAQAPWTKIWDKGGTC